MSLFPTKTRLALLAEVHAEAVIRGITPETGGHTWLTYEDGTKPRKVTAEIAELERAGWVELPDASAIFWRLTELGWQVVNGETA